MATFPPFRDTLVKCDNILRALRYPSILAHFKGETDKTGLTDQADEIVASQCACVALEIALAKIFEYWGITPDYVMGHR